MEQKLKLLEKEQQKLRQEVESLHKIINILEKQIQMLEQDVIETISISDKSSVSNDDGYLDELKQMNETLIGRIEKIIESKFNIFEQCIVEHMREEISNKNIISCGVISNPDPLKKEIPAFSPIYNEDTDDEYNI